MEIFGAEALRKVYVNEARNTGHVEPLQVVPPKRSKFELEVMQETDEESESESELSELSSVLTSLSDTDSETDSEWLKRFPKTNNTDDSEKPETTAINH
ncbi:unnamed protein product [Gongylonema pulchrum]|uniref:TMV resistance protein N-like n=1 Tax=Gongylonema pulchrum TaxID=637853 RepID=A0A183E1U8_9BILA|nr:unnamed protein product [Gongylonema pulchrum]